MAGLRSLGTLTLDLIAKVGGFITGMSQAERATERGSAKINKAIAGVKQGFLAVGSAVVAAGSSFAVAGKQFIDQADELSKLSQSIGISTENLSQLKYVADLSGTSVDDLGKAIGKLSKNAVDVSQGTGEARDAFAALGVSVTDAHGNLKDTEEILLEVADAFAGSEDGASKSAAALQIFGKSGLALIPFLNQGRKGIEELKNEADQLGLTLSGSAGRQAEAFNDNLTRLAAATKGIVAQFVQGLLPTLASFTEEMVESAKGSGALSAAIGLLNVAFKTLLTTGIVITSAFQQIGRVIYGVGAAMVSFVKGDFKIAMQEIKDTASETVGNVTDDIEKIARLWSGAGSTIVADARRNDEALKKTLIFGGGSKDRVVEFEITAKRVEDTPIQRFYEELDQLTKTSSEKAIEQYEKQRAALEELFRSGIIGAEEFNKRLDASIDDLLPEFTPTIKKVQVAFNEMTEFQRQAARNTQDIIADALENGFKGGLKGMLDAFMDMITKMAAQAVAADIAGKLFGNGAPGGGGGWVGKAFGLIGGFFGGGRATGGPVSAGKLYAINEREPEAFIPNSSGQVIPLSRLPAQASGGAQVRQNIYVQGRVDARTANQIANETMRRVRLASRLA